MNHDAAFARPDGAAGTARRAAMAGDDAEGTQALGCDLVRMQRVDARQRRRLGLDALQQRCNLGRAALGCDVHTIVIVANPASQRQLLRQAPDKGPEAHPLDDASHPDATRNNRQGDNRYNCAAGSGLGALAGTTTGRRL